jgi:putative transposase
MLDQDFTADDPDQKWGADISYIWTAEGWLYLAVAIDLFSRPGLIHHSDRGSQYCSNDYRKLLAKHKILASMSGKCNCYDNAMVETVFKTIKSELIWRTNWQSRCQTDIAIGRHIDGF